MTIYNSSHVGSVVGDERFFVGDEEVFGVEVHGDDSAFFELDPDCVAACE